MDPRAAERNLQLIRALMERANRWARIPAAACVVAAALAAAGAGICAGKGWDFARPGDAPALLSVWTGVAALSLAQFAAFTLVGAARRSEPVFSRATWATLLALVPGLFSGAALTLALPSQYWPGAWMLCYGTAVHGVDYFAGGSAAFVGTLFLACGAATLLFLKGHGVLLLGASFGGLHALFGLALFLRAKEDRDGVVFDPVEDR